MRKDIKIIHFSHPAEANGGSKARNDILSILKKEGINELNINVSVTDNKIKKLLYAKLILPQLIKRDNSNVYIIQFPLYSLFITKELFHVIKHYSNAKIIIIIHDLELIRRATDNSSTAGEEELQLLKMADGIISQNPTMTKFINQMGINNKIVSLGIFDYLNSQDINTNKHFTKSIVFAGSLHKSTFLQKLASSTQISLWGPHPAQGYPANIHYHGVKNADILPKYIDGSFGLVWDGPSLDTCSGNFGDYLRYNTPHKTSLYLSSGIPVIIWEKAAMANFIEKEGVGITIDSLANLDNVLDRISDEDYAVIKANTIALAQKLRSGFYVKSALNNILNEEDDLK